MHDYDGRIHDCANGKGIQPKRDMGRVHARSEDRTHDLRIAHPKMVIRKYETCALTS